MRPMLPITCLLAAAYLAAAPAESPRDFNWAQAQVGFLSQNNAACLKDSTGFGLGLGSWFKPRWGWEATYLHSRIEQQDGHWKANEDHLDATLLFKPFLNTGRWIPFLRAGAGVSRLESPLSLKPNSSTTLNLVAGLGTQVLLGERALGTLEVRSVTVETSARRQELQALAGLGFRWGGTRPAPRPPVVAPPPAPEPEPIPVPAAPVPAPAPIAPPPVPAPAPEPVLAPVPPPPPAKIVLGDAVLHFANNGDELGPEAIEAIQAVAGQLKAYPGEYSLVVSGHTSSLGSKAHNRALSLRRADAVAKVLIGAGIPAAKMTTAGLGPDKPVADNRTREGQSKNRRVEIDVITPQAVEKVRRDTATVDPDAPKAKARRATKAPAKAVKTPSKPKG